MEFRPRAATFTAFLAAVRVRVAALFPLGITARLSISLAAVAVLGAAANMLAQESVSIIRIRMSMPPNVPAPSLPAAPSVPIPQPAARPNALARKSLEGLTGAIDRFERASEARAKLKSRSEPYWRQVIPGTFLGYRKSKTTGAWIVRQRNESGG